MNPELLEARPAADERSNPAQPLPFSVSVARTTEDLAELVGVRSTAYARHNAPGAARLSRAEEQDHGDDAILVMARSKLNGCVVGSVRIQTRLLRPLMVESATPLPAEFINGTPIELMRGSVRSGVVGKMVSAALAKASYQISKTCDFSHIIVTCREPVHLMYRAYQFDDLLDGAMVDLPYSPGAKHKVLSLRIREAEARWIERNPALFRFMVLTPHPDIAIDYDYVFHRLKNAA